MKKLLCILLCSMSYLSADIELPSEFYVKQRPYTIMSTFDIETKQYKLGYVQKKFLSLRLEYDFYDIYDQLHAKAIKRLLSFGAVFDVVDANALPMGTVEQQFSFFFPSFNVVSPTGEILAQAVMNFWGTNYSISSPLFDTPVATLSTLFRFKDDWTIKIIEPLAFDQNKIDPRLFMVLVAFQSDKDYWNRVQVQSQSRDVKDHGAKFHKKLIKHGEKLKKIKAKAKHFKAIERHTHLMCKDVQDADFFTTCDKLVALLDSPDLSMEEKKALYLMLQKRL